MKLSDELKNCLDGGESCGKCRYAEAKTMLTCRNLIQAACEKIKAYEGLEKQERLVKLPCAVGDVVYVLAECEKIPQQLDGTLYSSDGSRGTATGYYCPYENDCPFDDEDFEGCEKYKNQTAVFGDLVKSITIEENSAYISTENCCVYSEIGRFVFLSKDEAEKALKEDRGAEHKIWRD